MENFEKLIPHEENRMYVYISFIQPSESEMNKKISDKPYKSRPKDMIISDLRVSLKNEPAQYKSTLKDFVQEELEQSIVENKELKELIQKIKSSDIVDIQPKHEPETRPVQIAEYVVMPEYQGIIGYVDFKPLKQLFNIK